MQCFSATPGELELLRCVESLGEFKMNNGGGHHHGQCRPQRCWLGLLLLPFHPQIQQRGPETLPQVYAEPRRLYCPVTPEIVIFYIKTKNRTGKIHPQV